MAGPKTTFRVPSVNALMREQMGRKNFAPITTGRRQGTTKSDRLYPPAPQDWPGSEPEWALYWAHLFLKLRPGQDFQYQYGVGDAGAILDFFEFGLALGINVQGLFWHYGFSAAKQVSDQEQKIRLESLGITLIGVDEDDALRDPIHYLKEALAGRDHSLAARGAV